MTCKKLILILCLIGTFQSRAQHAVQTIDARETGHLRKDLLTSRHTSAHTFIYKISDNEAKHIYHQRKWRVDTTFFHTLIDSYPTDSIYTKALSPGHYLRMYVLENELQLDITSAHDFNVEILNNSADLQIRVFSGTGEVIDNAAVKVGLRNIRFDEKTQTYRIHKANKKGLLEVTYEGKTFYYNLNRQYWNPLAKRVAKKVLYRTPLIYPWVPVRFVLFIPIDGVKSIIRGYPIGTIYRTKDFFVRLYQSTACLFDEYYCYNHNSYRFTSKHKGYLEFSKPIYAPGDTVKLKAFITKKGKPINKPAELVLMKNYSEEVMLTTLDPYRKGAYEFSFPISDTLDLTLDKSYEVELRKKEGKTYISAYFKYEDYELLGNELALRSDNKDQYAGDTLVVFASGTDENELKLLDARLEVFIEPVKILEYHQETVFVPDTIAYFEIPLKPTGETEIEIPSQLFPKVNLTHAVNVALLTSDNERITEKQKLTYYFSKEEFLYRLIRDSITFQYLVNGKSQPADVTIAGLDGYGNVADSMQVRLPYEAKVNPFFYEYKISGEGLQKTFSIADELSMLSFNTDRDPDSLTIRTSNPRAIPFSYNLYRTNNELKRGYGTDLQVDIATNSSQNYYMAIQYLWGGRVRTDNYEIGLNKGALNVEFNAPPIIYPGQEVELDLKVTDIAGKPVANVDLLAFGMTEKFDFDPEEMPRLTKESRSRDLINTFWLNQEPFYQEKLRYDYDKWRPLAALDTIEYFNFIYPGDQLYRYEYYPSDSVTQFSPFVLKDGVIQPVGVVYVDNVPVYFSWSTNEPYSFRISSGNHKLRIRTRDAEFEIGPIAFTQNKRIILSFDQDQLPKGIRRIEKDFKYSDPEKSNLYKYILPYQNTFGDRHGYIHQGNRYFVVRPPSNRTAFAGPVFPRTTNFILLDDFSLSFGFEPYYQHEFKPSLLKLKDIDTERLFPKYVTSLPNTSLTDLVWTNSMIEKNWDEELRKRRLEARRYYYPSNTYSGKGRLQIDINLSAQKLAQPLNTLFFKLDDAEFFRVYPGLSAAFHNLDEGFYKAIYFFDQGEYAIVDSLKIKVNGLNYRKVDSLDILPADNFSLKIDAIMEEFSNNQQSTLQPVDRNELYRTYQQQFQYFGEGEIISGFIYDKTGEPLPGVNVVVKGTTYGTISNIDGFYSLKVPYNKTVLNYSFIGFGTEERTIGSSTDEVFLTEDISQLQEVVVVGYGATHKSNLTASVATVGTPLYGKLAGVSVVGSPGAVKIRGASTTMGEKPLIIIDGVPYLGDLNDLDPKFIEKADVLNSESAVAIYGSRAANGVLVITTTGEMPGIALSGKNDKGAELSAAFVEAASEANTIRNNFSDEAFWLPRLKTGADGRASAKVKFPDDITKWRTFVYSISENKQSGQTEGEIKSFKPISAQLQIPRFLVEGDSSIVLGKSLNYTFDSVSVTTSFAINDNRQKHNQISFLNSWIDSLLIVPDKEDSMQIRYALEREDGYFDGEEWDLPVYRKGLELKEGYQATLTGDTTVSWTFSQEKGSVKIYADTDPISIIGEKIEFLHQYSYGCNEQLASKLKAMLIGSKLEDFPRVKKITSQQIRRVINSLENNQNQDGLWGWWNKGQTDLWISVHVVEALKMAVDEGFNVSIDLKRLADEAVWNLLSNNLIEVKTRWLYIASVMGLEIDKEAMIDQLDTMEIPMEDKLMFLKIKQLNGFAANSKWLVDSLQSDLFGGLYLEAKNDRLGYANPSLKNTATALTILANDTTIAEGIIEKVENYLLSHLSGTYYPNTYVTANIIAALSHMIGSEIKRDSELSIAGDMEETVTKFPYEKELPEVQSLTFSSSGRMPVFLNAYQTIWKEEPSMDSTSFVVKTRFESGSDYLRAGKPEKLLVRVNATKEAEYVIIEVPIPAGCSYNSKRNYFRSEVHREYFREKVSIFCKKLPIGQHEFEVDLLPRYSGTYTLNPSKVELMYFPVIKSHEGLKRISIQ